MEQGECAGVQSDLRHVVHRSERHQNRQSSFRDCPAQELAAHVRKSSQGVENAGAARLGCSASAASAGHAGPGHFVQVGG